MLKLIKVFNACYPKHENAIFLREFNAGIQQVHLTSFCESYNLANFIEQAQVY